MNIFFDTSSLFKLYHQEAGTKQLLNFLNKSPGYKIFVSQLALVEMYSALFKKVRIGHLPLSDAMEFLPVLNNDIKKFFIIDINTSLVIEAQQLLIKYGTEGLRSLDAIQMATVMSIKGSIDIALTGDILLKKIFAGEGIKCDF